MPNRDGSGPDGKGKRGKGLGPCSSKNNDVVNNSGKGRRDRRRNN